MRIGGIGIATVNVRGWDGSAWKNLPVESNVNPNLRVGLYMGSTQASILYPNVDGRDPSMPGFTSPVWIHAFNGSTWDRLRCDPNMHLNVNIGGLANLATAQVAMSATRATIKAANTSRKAITIKNIGANDVDIGNSAVTFGTGFRLAPGEALSDIRSTAAIYGICNTGLTSTVCYWEE